MQDSPQHEPLMRQPQAPAEIYMPEQPQVYLSRPPVSALEYQPLGPGQEMAIYPKRGPAIFRAVLCTITVLFLIGLVIITFLTNGPLQPSDIAPMIVTLVIVFAGSCLLGWLGWRMGFQLLFSPKPALAITREGITVGKLLMLRSGFFLPWADIDAIYQSSLGFKYHCIHPKNIDQFLSRFKGLGRMGRQSSWRISAPVMIPQIYLEKPVEEILQHLSARYVKELSYYHVQIRF